MSSRPTLTIFLGGLDTTQVERVVAVARRASALDSIEAKRFGRRQLTSSVQPVGSTRSFSTAQSPSHIRTAGAGQPLTIQPSAIFTMRSP